MRHALLRRAGACWLSAWCAGAACAAPVVPTAGKLAQQVFPGWRDEAAGRVQRVVLPALPGVGRSNVAPWRVGENRVRIDPALVLRSDATHLTLIAGLVPAAANGKPNATQSTPMALAAYQFTLDGGAWRLARRQGVFAVRGFFGQATLRAVLLPDKHQAVAVEYGNCWQGYCGAWLALFESDGRTVRTDPAVELALSGRNDAAAADCAQRLRPLVKAPAPARDARADDAPSAGHDCYVIDGSWAIDTARAGRGDLVVRYKGAISRADANAAPPVAVDQRQVLRYGSGRFRAVSGFDPVPGF